MRPAFIPVGQIVNAHGIRGEVKVNPHGFDPEFLTEFDTIYIDGQPVRVRSARVHKSTVLMALPGVDDMDAALASSAGSRSFAAPALAYIELLTQHIAKENTVLFPMAEHLLGTPALTAMHEDFERLEEERIGPGRHEAFHRLLDDLAAEYLPE